MASAWTYTTFTPDDPLFSSQWHLENTAQVSGSTAGEDADVVGAWGLGYTGDGVLLGIVDDGLEIAHEDLQDNVASGESWDYGGDDDDPTGNEHGTSVAGVAAGVGGNGIGITGAAPKAHLEGFAVLTSGATDADIADALARNAANTHAYNNSWGTPPIYGGVLYGYSEAPYSFHAAVATGLSAGRGGRGSVYLKAAGNWAPAYAGLDGTNGIRGVNVIAAVNADGHYTSYSEEGPCILVAAPSNDSGGHPGITTTDRTGSLGYSSSSYTNAFGGTSSATPLVTGVVALVLEARPTLRWWEVPLVLAETARKNDPNDSEWTLNAGGHWVNPHYGFGVVDAAAAVDLARTWTPRPGLASTSSTASVDAAVLAGDPDGASSTITVASDTSLTKVYRATVTLFIDHPAATDLEITLTSPAGTTSVFAVPLRLTNTNDSSLDGIPLVTWRDLDEEPDGGWTLTVRDGEGEYGSWWSSWTLALEGEAPATSAALVAKRAAEPARPPAPTTGPDEVAWWNGCRWDRARRDDALVAEWTRSDTSSRLAGRPEVDGAALRGTGFRLWRVRAGADARALVRAARAAGARAGGVFRDGPRGRGRPRALTGRVLLRLDPRLPPEAVRAWTARRGLEVERTSSLGAGWILARPTDPTVSPIEVARDALADPDVRFAEPDWWTERSLD